MSASVSQIGSARSTGATVVDLDLRRAAAAELATRAKAGSDAAFQELVRRMTPLIRHLERDHYIPGGDRNDLHQEALFGLHKATKDFRPDGGAGFESFAVLCIRRQIATAVKTGNRRKHLVLTHRGEPQRILRTDEVVTEDELESFADVGSDPHDVLTRREDFDTFVRLASGTLSVYEGEVMGLWLSGLSYGDIAKETDTDTKAVDNAMQRCKRKLTEGMAAAA